ncbi:MAG: hypothetical protein EZS28_045810, partial [Streblomastix strix]
AVAAVAAAAVAVTASKYKNIEQRNEIRQFREPMETRTGWKMKNTTDRYRKRDRSNLKEKNRPRVNNNPIHNNRKYNKSRSK